MFLREQKSKLTNLRFLYSQDLSNCTTVAIQEINKEQFLYSQDLSNCTTGGGDVEDPTGFCTLKI